MNAYRLPQQAVILAAGHGSRLEPFHTRQQHKSAVRLMGQSLIQRTIRSLKELGISTIFVIHAPQDAALPAIIEAEGVRSIIQPEPIGAGDALLRVAEHLETAPFLVINAHQINVADHLGTLNQSPPATDQVVLFSQATDQPQRYGMLGLAGDRVTAVVEKPSSTDTLSDQRLLGLYILTPDFLNLLKTTPTEEYQLEAALHQYAQGHDVRAVMSSAPALSLKYAWDLFDFAEALFAQAEPQPVVHPTATIHSTALIEGPVIIGAGCQVHEYAIIKGPCYLGDNTVVGSYCKLRSGAVLEAEAQVQSHSEIKHSLLGTQTTLHSGFIGDSIIGENVKIGAGFVTANRRFDRRTVRVRVKDEPVDTNRTAFGALIGDDVSVGIQTGTNPGAVIPSGAAVSPGTIVSPPTAQG